MQEIVLQRKKSRVFLAIDGLRGLAAILVVLRHTESFFAPISFQESYLAVDLFFTMSGAVIAHSYEKKLLGGLSPWRFAWQRVIRIYPLYILGCAIGIVALCSLDGRQNSVTQVIGYAGLALFMLPSLGGDLYPLNGPSWSLFFELAANFFYGAFARHLGNKALAAIVGVSGLALAVVLVWSKSHSLNVGFWMASFPTGGARVGFSFFAGILIYRIHARHEVMVVDAAANFAGWAMLALAALILTAAPSGANQACYDWFMVTLVFPGVVYASLSLDLSGSTGRLFKLLGFISYPAYVLHAPASHLLRTVAVPIAAPWSGFGFLLLLVPACCLLNHIYDAPVRRLLSRQTLPSRAEPAMASSPNEARA